MVSVKCENGEFLVKGTFDMGMAGVFENKEYGEGNIGFDSLIGNVEDFTRYTLDGSDGEYAQDMRQFFSGVPRDAASLAKAMEAYINKWEEKVLANQKQLNDYFIYQLILNWVDCDMPFWECEEAILPEYADAYDEETYQQLYEDESLRDAVDSLCDEYEHTPNDGSMEKTDVGLLARELFPMFDFDSLINSIHPDCLTFESGLMSVQFSDGWNNNFYCSACACFDSDLTPNEWQNF